MPKFAKPQAWVCRRLREGLVIPADPLALTHEGKLDERYQRALTRYYVAAGAGGLAVGVHTTQFEIREPKVGLLAPVLQRASTTLDEIESRGGPRIVRIAGICGGTPQAMREAELAMSFGYHAGMVSLADFGDCDDNRLIKHCRSVARVIPLVGFYLQRAVGGRRLGFEFWSRFAEIPNVVAIKIAPFNRYETLDVVRGLATAGRAKQIALYTGNDDNIVGDLLTRYDLTMDGKKVSQRIVGGLLGHWAIWTKRAVEIHRELRELAKSDEPVPPEVLSLGVQITDCNAAVFDVANNFTGCIAGIQHILHQQGLLASPRCLNPDEGLSPGQQEQIERVRRDYPHLIDDEFVSQHLDEWLD